MPIIIGIILGVVCLISGVGFWGTLPNHDLLMLFDLQGLSIQSKPIDLLLFLAWGSIFLISITTLLIITATVFNKFYPDTLVHSIGNFFIGGAGIIVGALFIGGIGAFLSVFILGYIGAICVGLFGVYLGAYIGGTLGGKFGKLLGRLATNYIKANPHRHKNDLIAVSVSALSAILIVSIALLGLSG